MKFAFCKICGRSTRYKRSVEVGTLIAGLFSGDFSVAFISCYPKRCIICGNELRRKSNLGVVARGLSAAFLILIFAWLLAVLIAKNFS